jgi:NLI interacting factor-like phosphatase
MKGRLTVVLDLDGTLISSYTPKRAPRLPAGSTTYIVGRGGRLNPGGVFVVERPGLARFVSRLSEFAGMPNLHAPLLKLQLKNVGNGVSFPGIHVLSPYFPLPPPFLSAPFLFSLSLCLSFPWNPRARTHTHPPHTDLDV